MQVQIISKKKKRLRDLKMIAYTDIFAYEQIGCFSLPVYRANFALRERSERRDVHRARGSIGQTGSRRLAGL